MITDESAHQLMRMVRLLPFQNLQNFPLLPFAELLLVDLAQVGRWCYAALVQWRTGCWGIQLELISLFFVLMGPPCKNSRPSGNWKVHAKYEG